MNEDELSNYVDKFGVKVKKPAPIVEAASVELPPIKKSKSSGMKYDCLGIEFGFTPVDYYPDLASIKSFASFTKESKIANKTAIMKYIIMLYSIDSPINKKPLLPLMERKVLAARYSELITANDTADLLREQFGNVVMLEEDIYINIVFDFLLSQNELLWVKLSAVEQAIENAMRRLMKPIDSTDDNKELDAHKKNLELLKTVNEYEKAMNEYIEEFFLDPEIKVDVIEKKPVMSLIRMYEGVKNKYY